MDIPAPDHTLSPHTGYTRAHWVAVADRLLATAWRWATPRGARIDLPGPPSVSGTRSDGLEGYARTFLAAAFRVAGDGGADPHGWLPRYADGLAAGTATPGRDDAESWPRISHQHLGHGQPMVESASIALGLRLTRPWLWDHLSDDVRDRAATWLLAALDHRPAPNNWHLFPFTVAGFLESVGRGDERTTLARDRARALLETWYRGDGWYSDGDGRAFDHYNGWALHLYPVLDDHLSGNVSAYGMRLHDHLASFALLFGGDGAPVHFGRSLTYRFAAASAVAIGAVTGHTPLSPGTSRRIVSGALRYFLDRGAVDADGLLSVGWHGPHAATAQDYSGPASPYWASKAFACLLAPPDHPLWTEQETEAPSEGPDRVLSLPAPGLLIQTTSDGIVRLHNHGSDHVGPTDGSVTDNPHYSRLAYSTRTGPTAPGNPADNHFCVMAAGVPSVRKRIHPLGAGHGDGWGWAASWHRPVFPSGPPFVPGLRVDSVTVARGRYELRVHRVTGAPQDAVVTQTGWATGPDERTVLHPLSGWATQDEVRAPAGTAFTRWATVPRLTAPASDTVYAAMAALTSEEEPLPTAHATADAIEVRWADGAETRIAFVSLSVTTHISITR